MEMYGECGIKRIHGKARCNDWGKMNNILWSRPVSGCTAVTSHRARNVFASTVTRERFANMSRLHQVSWRRKRNCEGTNILQNVCHLVPSLFGIGLKMLLLRCVYRKWHEILWKLFACDCLSWTTGFRHARTPRMSGRGGQYWNGWVGRLASVVHMMW